MDPFTQRMIENAEKRSKTLGISNTSKFPLTEYQEENTKSNSKNRRAPSVPDKSPKRIIRQISDQTNANEDNLSKENVDVALEINITTGSNVKLQVEVEERDIDADGNVISSNIRREDCGSIMDSRAQKIGLRDTSKNRLQRLGKLYSDNENLSSPIHCTEGEFHVDAEQEHRPKQRLGRLAELASSINNWEDDTQHTEVRSVQSPNKPKIVGSSIRNTGATPKKYPAPKPPVNKENEKQSAAGTKQLKWDKSVMDALQSQGFERRQSSTSKLVYDYDKDQQPPTADPQQIVSKKVKYQTNTSREREVPQTTSDGTKFVSQLQVSVANEKKTETTTTAKPQVAKGFVSGKAAIFNGSNASSSSSSNAQSSRINQKDPAEMSLKERMALFEKNKGTAPMPITAIGIAPSVKQIMVPQKSTGKVEFTASAIPKSNTNVAKSSPSKTKILSYNQPSFAESKAEGNCIRNTVKALLEKPATISESQISDDIKRQRQQEMEVLLNRYQNKEQKESETKSPPRAKLPPPPPPPMPSFANSPKPVEAKCSVKRHSDGRHSDSHEVRSALEDVKRIKVNPPRDGRLYPGLSDIETTGTESDGLDNSSEPSREPRTSSSYHEEKSYHFRRSNGNDDDDSYMDSEDADTSTDLANGSLGLEILSVMQKNSKSAELHKRHNNELRYQQANLESSLSSDNSENVDDYLNEALDEEDDSFDQDGMLGGSSSKVTPRKGSISSNSFSYRKNPKHVDFDTDTDKDEVAEANNHNAFRTPVKSELKVHTSDDTNLTTLVHTVSFYRKQQNGEVNYTPIKKMLRTPKQGNEYCSTTDDDSEMEDQEEARKDKIKKLLDESMKQQQIISQTSRALNLCAATVEFSGSIEAVESERHLLVAIHRHRAIKDEILRLNRQFVRPLDAPTERGRLTVKEITIPLNSTYVKKLSEEAICGHHLVCLLKYNENVLATRTVLTLPGLRTVKFPDTLTLNNVYTDFRITLEIYGMIAQRESLPHEAKYHINVNKKGGPKTPKGKKGAGSSMVMPMFQSPAGPNAVRSTALTQYGFIIFSAREVKQSSFTVNDLVNVSPLEGKVHMKIGYDIQIAVDHSGFLTMYEDTSGFGAWHRRWCHLHGTTLSYWKYPEDEKTKTPIGSLDLQSCTSQKAIPAPRDVCARKHTILLESQRPRLESDVATLTTIPRGKDTIVRHLLAADTTEDRDLWCMHFNKTLVLVRTWGKQV